MVDNLAKPQWTTQHLFGHCTMLADIHATLPRSAIALYNRQARADGPKACDRPRLTAATAKPMRLKRMERLAALLTHLNWQSLRSSFLDAPLRAVASIECHEELAADLASEQPLWRIGSPPHAAASKALGEGF
jgi:hypothetical protein